ncbi:MAG: sensor histidine kinase [Acidimicrobiia bacterium]
MAAEDGRHRGSRFRALTASIRVRTTAAAVIVVGLALVVGGVMMTGLLRRALERDTLTSARLRAQEVATVLESGSGPGSLAVEDREDSLIQVLDQAGQVVASSPNMTGQAPVADLEAGGSVRVDRTVLEDAPFLVVAEGARSPAGRFTVLVARSTDDVEESTRRVSGLLAAGGPLLLLVVGVTSWRVVGRAMAPVEAIRSEVDSISATELHRRVGDPAGRDEIARLAATMNRMLDRLEAAQSRQRRFVSDASHELRSPVASIRQHAEVALAHPDQISATELAQVVLDEDLRVQHLVEDLLLLARADEGTLASRPQAVDLDDLVFEVATHLRTATTLRIDTTSVSAGRVAGDEAQLRRLLRNLGDNAARHARTRVGFSLGETPAGTILLRVDDDGPGVPEGERRRIFERFVRLDDARSRDTGGSGLGLAIVAEIAAAHAGTVTATGSPLGGARFEVEVPAHAG